MEDSRSVRDEPAPQQTEMASEGKRSRGYMDLLRRLRQHPSALVGGIILLVIILVALAAPLVAPYGPLQTNAVDARQSPNFTYLLGTDHLGRDILSRIIHGSRITLMLGVIAVAIGGVIGIGLGVVAGFFRGIADLIIMQFIDILLAFPGFLLALAVVSVLGTGIYNVMIAVGISLIPQFARIVRGSTLSASNMEYVEAARVLGAGNFRIITKHVLPNVLAPAMVIATVGVAGAILTGAALSFLGVGAQPPEPEWGLMINEGRRFLRNAWWISTFPGVAIMISVIAINLIGDAFRDILDPRLRT